MKFIQTGDLHLDSIHRYDDGERMYFDEIEGLRYITDTVEKEGIELLFITGDLFDSKEIRERTLSLVLKELGKLKNTRVFISPGNHDYIGLTDIYTDLKWPENVHIFREFEKVMIDGTDIAVYGAGFKSANESGNLIPDYVETDPRSVSILCLHGSAENDRNYNRMGRNRLSSFTYCALGHEHQMRIINNSQIYYGYAGSPVPMSFTETGEHGFITGDIHDGIVSLKFTSFPSRRFLNIEINTEDEEFEMHVSSEASDFNDISETGITDIEISDIIKRKISEEMGKIDQPIYLRVTLKGRVTSISDTEFIEKSIKADERFRIRYLEINDETEVSDSDLLSNANSYAEELFIKRMNELKEKDLHAVKALKYGLKALRGELKV